MGRIITNLVIWLMHNTRFSMDNRIKCTTALLDKLNFIPHTDIIELDITGKLVVNGRTLDLVKSKQLMDSARAILDNQVRNLVREQVAFKAVNVGVHNGTKPEELIWARVALWIYQQEDVLYHMLAQDE